MNDNDLLLDWLITWQIRWIMHGNECAALAIDAMQPDLRDAIDARTRNGVRVEVAKAYARLDVQQVAEDCMKDAACEVAKTWAKHMGVNALDACQRARNKFTGVILLGATLAETIQRVLDDDQRRVTHAILWHRIEGETVEQIRKQAAITHQIGERSMKAAMKTAAAAAMRIGGEVVWPQLPFDALIWLSVLDSRTSEICRYRHGRVAPLPGRSLPRRYDGHPKLDPPKARPPAHPNCRSVIMPLLRNAGLPTIPSYYQWLRRQPANIQNEALGPTRYNLWKRQGVAPERFSDEGRRLTWPELRAKL